MSLRKYWDATVSLNPKLRVEKIEEDIKTAVNSPRKFYFSREKKLMFKGRDAMIHRVEIRVKASGCYIR